MAKLEGKYLGSFNAIDTTVGNGSTTAFVLSSTPINGNAVWVSLNGLDTTDYTVNAGTKTVTFNSAPATAQDIIFRYIKKD